MINHGLPEKQGLYDPAHEKDACGVGCIVQKNGERSHEIVYNGLQILKNLQHRGASGEDPYAGDGAGILTQLPHAFFKKILAGADFAIPDEEEYAVGMTFLPRDEQDAAACKKLLRKPLLKKKKFS